MNWTSSKDKLPPDGEKVLTYIGKEFKLAVFDRQSGGFFLGDENFLWIEMEEIWWTALTIPS